MRAEFHPEAAREVEEAQAWYESRSMFAASAFLREFSLAMHASKPRLINMSVLSAEPKEFSSTDSLSRSITGFEPMSSKLWPLLIRSADPAIGLLDDAV